MLSMNAWSLVILLWCCGPSSAAQPGFYETQGVDALCYVHTANNIIRSAFWSKSAAKDLAKNLDMVWLRGTEWTNRVEQNIYYSNGAVVTLQPPIRNAPLLNEMLRVAGFAYTHNGAGISFQLQQYKGDDIAAGSKDANIQADLLRPNFRAFLIHQSYSDTYSHFTAITKEGTNYFYLNPSFPFVDVLAANQVDWTCTGKATVQFYPKLINGQKDCERLHHYTPIAYFEYLVSLRVGTPTTVAGTAGVGEGAVRDKLHELATGYGANHDCKAFWVVPVFEMTGAAVLTYSNAQFNKWQNPTDSATINNDFVKRQKNLWRLPALLTALRAEYHAKYNAVGGGGFWSARHTRIQEDGDTFTRYTCRIPDSDPTGWNTAQTKDAKLAEWRRRRGQCTSSWQQDSGPPVISYEPRPRDREPFQQPYQQPYLVNYRYPFYYNYSGYYNGSQYFFLVLALLLAACACTCWLALTGTTCFLCGYLYKKEFKKDDMGAASLSASV